MKHPIKIPVDYTLDFFDLNEWKKNVGDHVKSGDVVLEYETQKATVELPADANGVLTEIIVPKGEKVFRPDGITSGSWDVTVGYIETEAYEKVEEGAEVPPAPPSPPETKHEPKREKPRVRVRADGVLEEIKKPSIPKMVHKDINLPKQQPNYVSSTGNVRASPHVRKIALEKGVDLKSVNPTGPDGIVALKDLEKDGSKNSDSSSDFELVPLTSRRKGIAENLTKSWKEIPHAGSEVIVDLSKIANIRTLIKKRYNDDGPCAKELMRWDAFIITAAIHHLQGAWKIINSTFTWDGLKLHKHINVGVSLADQHGLIVPVMHDVETLKWGDVASKLDSLYKKVATNQLSARDYKGGTFTFNNPGALGGYSGSSILPYNGGSAILSFHQVVDNKSILSIRFDHRAYDGKEALGFLVDVKDFIEKWPEYM